MANKPDPLVRQLFDDAIGKLELSLHSTSDEAATKYNKEYRKLRDLLFALGYKMVAEEQIGRRLVEKGGKQYLTIVFPISLHNTEDKTEPIIVKLIEIVAFEKDKKL